MIATHQPGAGLNPLADAASYLFSVLDNLKQLKSYPQLEKLQTELINEVNNFLNVAKNIGYNPDYLLVCRHVICVTFDDLISQTTWGGEGQWDAYSLLATFHPDAPHQDKFFSILKRSINEPALYADLMELMYLCLSMGYQGQYRTMDNGQHELDQIIESLYKHIKVYRGNFSKILSPTALKAVKSFIKPTALTSNSLIFITMVTACAIMAIFVGLGYLMDAISNETYQNIEKIQLPVPNQTAK